MTTTTTTSVDGFESCFSVVNNIVSINISYLYAHHSVRPVGVLADRVGSLGRVEAGPARARVELGRGAEELRVAADAVVDA